MLDLDDDGLDEDDGAGDESMRFGEEDLGGVEMEQ